MYETIKNYINRYSWVWYLIVAGIACLCCWIIYVGGNDSDYQRSVDDLERAKGQQRESLDINKDVTDSVNRSAQLNRQASERIDRAQEYQQRASESLEQGTSRLDEAESLLERNAALIRDVEQRHQAKQGDGRETTQTAQHVGAD